MNSVNVFFTEHLAVIFLLYIQQNTGFYTVCLFCYFRFWVFGWHIGTETKRTHGRIRAPSCRFELYYVVWPLELLKRECVFAFTEEETSLRVLAAIHYYVLDFSRVKCECTVHHETVTYKKSSLWKNRTPNRLLVCST